MYFILHPLADSDMNYVKHACMHATGTPMVVRLDFNIIAIHDNVVREERSVN